MSEETNERQYSEQEMKDMRAKTIAYYKDTLGVLKLQAETETLRATIEKGKFEALDYRMRYTQLTLCLREAMEQEGLDDDSKEETDKEPVKE